MNPATAQQILADCMAAYRNTAHSELAARIRLAPRHHNPLNVVHGSELDGTEYTIEVNVFWDDERAEQIRVIGDLTSASNQGVGFAAVFVPDATDTFIMANDGSFVGE